MGKKANRVGFVIKLVIEYEKRCNRCAGNRSNIVKALFDNKGSSGGKAMEDEKIIQLYWNRNHDAITETASKYGKLCFRIAHNILGNYEDSEECVNDTYLGVWNAIPRKWPTRFSAFISKITRNLALKKFAYISAEKRNPQMVCSFEELSDCVSGKEYVETELENRRIERAVNAFLWHQPKEKRSVFILRYWYFDSLDEICRRTGYSQSKVKSMLFHMRKKLREYLEKEGIEV